MFQQIQKAGLKLSRSKCAFGHPKIEFLERSITTKGIAPLEDRIDKFFKNLKLPTSVKSLQRYIGFVQFYRQYIPKLDEKLVPLYKLLQKDVKFVLTQVHKVAIFDNNESGTSCEIVTQVTFTRKATPHHVRCKRTRSRVRTSHRRLHVNQRRQQENVCNCSVRFRETHRKPDVTNIVRERVPGNALRFP